MMRYIPFIIISLVLYTLFFYNNQQPDLLSETSATKHTEKIVPLDFEKLAQQEQQALSSTPSAPPIDSAVKETDVKETHVIKKPLEPVVSPSVNQADLVALKHQRSQFQASIKSTLAADVALIKAEFYEKDFHLDLPAPPRPKAKPKVNSSDKTASQQQSAKLNDKAEIPNNQNSVSQELLKHTQHSSQQVAIEPVVDKVYEKPKRSFKKQVKPMSATTGLNLQQAIAVSGNKPDYPQQAKIDKQQGFITVTFTVNMQGKTKLPTVVTSSGHQILDNAVLEFIEKERFMPALKGIEKVTSEQQFSFDFVLK